MAFDISAAILDLDVRTGDLTAAKVDNLFYRLQVEGFVIGPKAVKTLVAHLAETMRLSEEYEEDCRTLRDENATLEAQKSELQAEVSDLLNDKDTLEARIKKAQEALRG